MPSRTVKARTTKYNAQFWAQKRRFLQWELVGMKPYMTMDDLVLTWQGGGRPLKVNGAIESLQVTRTIEGASTIEMVINDPQGHLFNEDAGRAVSRPVTTKAKNQAAMTDEQGKPLNAAELSGRAVELTLDDVVFRLTRVDGGLDDVYTLTFEDRIVYWLRHKDGPLAASRASVTRAQFILKMLREIKTETIPFICPSGLSTRQPQAKPADSASLSELLHAAVMVDPPLPNVFNRTPKPKTTDTDTPSEPKGLKNATGLYVKTAKATHEQKRNMNEMLDQATGEKGATKRAILSAIVTVITETRVLNEEEGTGDSTGMFQVTVSTGHAYNVEPMDIGGCTHVYMTQGFAGAGGAIQVAKDHPDWPIYRIAQAVQGSGEGRSTNGKKNYGPWVEQAKQWLDAYSGGDDDFGEGTGSYRKSYQYKRDKDEDSWECGLRLADEVQWRLFPVGRAMMYSAEIDLFRRKVSEVVNKGDERLLAFPWGMDWNRPVNECEIEVVLDSWGAYPGTCITLDGFGAPDGRWLVTEMTRGWFDNVATLTLKQPLSKLKEPAAEIGTKTVSVSGEGTKGEIGTLYNVCKHISAGTQGYLYGGQHGIPFSQMSGQKPLDCSSSVSLALYRADMWDDDLPNYALVSGDFDKWGAPGSGHLFTVMYSGTHVWIQFEEAAGMMYKRFDTSPHGDTAGSGPRMRKTARTDQARFQKRHWPGM